jgi:hypothetical protein
MFEDDNPNNFYKNVPPQENTKSASKLLISLGADFGRWRELSNSGGLAGHPVELVEGLGRAVVVAR